VGGRITSWRRTVIGRAARRAQTVVVNRTTNRGVPDACLWAHDETLISLRQLREGLTIFLPYHLLPPRDHHFRFSNGLSIGLDPRPGILRMGLSLRERHIRRLILRSMQAFFLIGLRGEEPCEAPSLSARPAIISVSAEERADAAMTASPILCCSASPPVLVWE